MQWVLLLCALATTVAARAPVGPHGYHDRVGIPLAAAIRAAEEQAGAGAPSGRVFNGAPAALGQFPYFGGLVIHFPNSPASVCGSALVSSTRLLTAAHCWSDGFRQASMFTVVLGSVMLFSGGTRIDTADVEMHAGWQPPSSTLAHDIAIIRIAPVSFNDNIQPNKLPAGAEDFAGAQAQAIGIGMTGFGIPVTTNAFLAHFTTSVLSNAQCSQNWGSFVTDYIVCTAAGANNANICTGDSGGPITVGNVLVGLVSFGNGMGRGCEEGLPAGHSRVSAYHDWISERL